MKYSLRQLQVFLATAHHENISRAADDLAMSQSAASSALKELEQQFDIQLFDRVGKRLQLNAMGKQIRNRAQAFMEQARELEHALLQHSSYGLLKVGATMTIGHDIAIDIIDAFKQQHPESQVQLRISNTASIVQQVENFELDVGLIEGELSHPQLESIQWLEDELVIFAHPEHPLAAGPTQTIRAVNDQALSRANWILREPGSGTRQSFDRAMHDLLAQLNIALELQLPSAIKQAVAKQLGIGCLSRLSLEREFAEQRFIELACPQRNFKRHFYIILRRDKYHSADLQRWLTICQSFNAN